MEFPKNAKIITTASTAPAGAEAQQLLDNTILPTTAIFACKTIDENNNTGTHTLRTIEIYPSESSPPTHIAAAPPPPTAAGGDGATAERTVSTYYAGYLRRPDQAWPEKPFILWADLRMKGKHLHLLPHASKALIDAVVRDEPGVLCYLWLQDLDDKRHVSVLECYVSKDACKAHEATEAYGRFVELVGPCAEGLDINYAEWKGGTLV